MINFKLLYNLIISELLSVSSLQKILEKITENSESTETWVIDLLFISSKSEIESFFLEKLELSYDMRNEYQELIAFSKIKFSMLSNDRDKQDYLLMIFSLLDAHEVFSDYKDFVFYFKNLDNQFVLDAIEKINTLKTDILKNS